MHLVRGEGLGTTLPSSPARYRSSYLHSILCPFGNAVHGSSRLLVWICSSLIRLHWMMFLMLFCPVYYYKADWRLAAPSGTCMAGVPGVFWRFLAVLLGPCALIQRWFYGKPILRKFGWFSLCVCAEMGRICPMYMWPSTPAATKRAPMHKKSRCRLAVPLIKD